MIKQTTSVFELPLRQTQVVVGFVAFALAYFFSTLIRAITATLSPTLMTEFSMSSGDLGLLAGAYFLGFSLTQLPLGNWLDRYGPKKVLLAFLCVAVAGCWCFSVANQFATLWIARMLTGIGVSACLMAPLTAYRRWFDAGGQMRSNAWMLMVGSLGIIASTLPVQWLLPVVGWRSMFVGLGGMILVAMALIAWVVPRWRPASDSQVSQSMRASNDAVPVKSGFSGYKVVFLHPYFQRHFLLALFVYGGVVAMQTLWSVPWMIRVGGYTPLDAAKGLFGLNVCMLLAFLAWGVWGPVIAKRGVGVDQLVKRGLPLSFLILALIVLSPNVPILSVVPVWVWWSIYCVSCTVIVGAQPAVALVFPPELAGRALSAYNLLIFFGVFVVQWCVGWSIDVFKSWGWSEVAAYQGAIALYGVVGLLAYARFLWAKSPHLSS